jgi:hypothetical protein
MTDLDFSAALEEAIAFHQDAVEAFPPYSHFALHGRHAKALQVLRECRARLFPRRKEAVIPTEDVESESLIRIPYKD